MDILTIKTLCIIGHTFNYTSYVVNSQFFFQGTGAHFYFPSSLCMISVTRQQYNLETIGLMQEHFLYPYIKPLYSVPSQIEQTLSLLFQPDENHLFAMCTFKMIFIISGMSYLFCSVCGQVSISYGRALNPAVRGQC